MVRSYTASRREVGYREGVRGREGLGVDGKRSGLSESALDVLSSARGSFHLIFIYIFLYRGGVRGGENHSGSDSVPGLADDGKRQDSLSLRWTLHCSLLLGKKC